MVTTVQVRPYELLVRWRNGVISGAHVGFEDAIFEDGVFRSASPRNVQPVDIGSGQGFPLSDILTTLSADSLVRIGELEAQVRELQEKLAAKEV